MRDREAREVDGAIEDLDEALHDITRLMDSLSTLEDRVDGIKCDLQNALGDSYVEDEEANNE